MKDKFARTAIALLIVLSVVQVATTRQQQWLNEQLIKNEVLATSTLYAQSFAMSQLRLQVASREAEIEKLQCQIDLVSAASRSSWGDAYRVMRSAFHLRGGC